MYKFKRSFAVFLAIIITVTMMIGNFYDETSAEVVEDNNEPVIVKELVERRELTIKHFERSDGSFEAVSYEKPVHYEENGVLKQIDNRMIEILDTDEPENDEVYQTIENDFTVKISKNIKSEKLVRVKKGNYKLIWGIENTEVNNESIKIDDMDDKSAVYEAYDETNEEVKKEIDRLSESERMQFVPGIASSVMFKDIVANIDLEYLIESSKIKENIIIKKYVENPEFTFLFQTKGLKAKLTPDNSIVFYDEADETKEVMSSQMPFMVDANGIICSDIKVELVETENKYNYKLVPSSEWLKAPERAFPVKIDPPIETNRDSKYAIETSVFPKDPYRMTDTADHVWLGYGSDTGQNWIYSKFTDMPQLTNAFEVTKADLYMFANEDDTTLAQADAYSIDKDWLADKIDWNNKPLPVSKLSSCDVGGPPKTQYSWDITSEAVKWCAGKSIYGVMIRLTDQSNYSGLYGIHSSEIADATLKPYAKIFYTYKDTIKQYLGKVEAESLIGKSSDVTITPDGLASAGHCVSGIKNEDDYLLLNVNSRRSGVYNVTFRMLCSSVGNIVKTVVNEGCADQYTTSIELTSESSWKSYGGKLRLRSGSNTLKIVAYEGYGWSIDYVSFCHNLPDIIEAENFNSYSSLPKVSDDEATASRYIGDHDVNQYYDYIIKVQRAGQYRMNFMVASTVTTGKFKVSAMVGSTEKELIKEVVVPNSGSSTIFKTVSKDVYLTKDISRIKITAITGDWSIDKFECVPIGPRTIQAGQGLSRPRNILTQAESIHTWQIMESNI